MCYCTPSISMPWCGDRDCQPPHAPHCACVICERKRKPRRRDTSLNTVHWAIQFSAHPRRFLHTNWVVGRGIEAFPGAAPIALFATQLLARTWLRTLRGTLPRRARVVKVIIETENYK